MMAAAPVTAAEARGSWSATLDLLFESRRKHTVLGRRAHRGPLLVQRPFYPEGGLCHVYILHPPAGVVGGDRLTLTAAVEPDAQALMTTPAATKFYRSDGRIGEVSQYLRVAGGSSLEWLPQENIVFDGARASVSTMVDLHNGARFIGWDMTCLGRPANGEDFAGGSWQQRLSVRLEGAPLVNERLQLDGSQHWERVGIRDCNTLATLYAYPCSDAEIKAARDGQDESAAESWAGITLCDGLLVCRLLTRDGGDAQSRLRNWWQSLRPLVIGRDACAPRIWAT
jgi:urease accessory protein